MFGDFLAGPERRRSSRRLLAIVLVGIAVLGSALVLPTSFPAPSAAPSHNASSAPVAPARSSHVASAPTAPPVGRSAPFGAPRVAFRVAGSHPASWGGPTPPGALEPNAGASAHAAGWASSYLDEHCYGIWPTQGGQSQYYDDCYGHDEPGFSPYSTLGGSAGNVTWNVTLPVDRGPTENQSNLYSAIWFGMTLADPYAWLDQCFLELQFYPDSSWSDPTGTVQGVWVGAAVAWQIEASTGFENPCFYAPLTVEGQPSAFFQMTQGDTINVTMTGWTGNANGENLTIQDVSSGASSSLVLYNSTGGYPLDPAYSTASWTNSLLWTPGDEGPVSFAFETGHTGNSAFPNTNQYGGCSPGSPPPSTVNPAVPCPSYDPGFWANDTLLPWQIHSPTFFNATARQTATQVGFTQDLGGLAFDDGANLGFSTCLGRETSAYCSYPWYSYSCNSHAFNFGATDYAGTTTDFGKLLQYRQFFVADAAGRGYYPATNDSVPACGGSVGTVSVAATPTGTGVATFLNRTVAGSTPTMFANVTDGTYSVAAMGASGEVFVSWLTSGSVSVANAHDAFTTLTVAGSGSVSALFATRFLATSFSNVTFSSATPGAEFSLTAGFASDRFGLGGNAATQEVANNTTLSLAPGLYTVEAQPPAGYNFTSWSVRGGAALSTPTTPVTVVDVVGASSANVTATFRASSATATVLVLTGALTGSITLNGTSYSGIGFAVLPVGTYPISVLASNASTNFLSWSYGGTATMTNFSASTRVTLEGGTSEFYPVGYTPFNVTLNDSSAHGTIAWNTTANASAVAVASGTTVLVNVTGGGSPFVNLTAVPSPGWAFSTWTVANPLSATIVTNPNNPNVLVALNASGGYNATTVLASYVAASNANLSYNAVPSADGSLGVGYSPTLASSGTASIAAGANGTYLTAFPKPGFVVRNLTFSGGTAVPVVVPGATGRPWGGYVWSLEGIAAGTNVTANVSFVPLRYPVTFVGASPVGSPSALLNGSTLGTGDTMWLPNGTYSLGVGLASGATFDRWTTSASALAVVNSSTTLTSVVVAGPGTIYSLDTLAIARPLVAASASPTSVSLLPAGAATFNASAECLGNTTCAVPPSYGWSLTNPSAGSLNTTVGPSVRFTAASTYASTSLLLTATLNGTVIAAPAVAIAVVPALVGLAVSSAPAPIFSGQSVLVGAAPVCTANLPCPPGAGYSWSLSDPTLGTLTQVGGNSTFPSRATFQSGAYSVGTELVRVSVSLGSAVQNASVMVTLLAPQLSEVTVSPMAAQVAAGSTTSFTAVGTCTAGLLCPGAPSYAWRLSSASLGTLNSSSGGSVSFTAGAVNATGWLNATGTLNSVNVVAAAVAITVTATPSVLSSVTVTPASANTTVGSVEVFSATVACTPAPCPGGVVIAWAVAPRVGTLSSSAGTSTALTATTAGTATLWANATLDGHARSGSASVVVHGASGGTTSSTPFYDNPLLWIVLVVLVVVVLAAAVLLRKKPAASEPPKPWK